MVALNESVALQATVTINFLWHVCFAPLRLSVTFILLSLSSLWLITDSAHAHRQHREVATKHHWITALDTLQDISVSDICHTQGLGVP